MKAVGGSSRRSLLARAIAALTVPAVGLVAACGTGAPSTAVTAGATSRTEATMTAQTSTKKTAAATASKKVASASAPKAAYAKGKVWLTFWGSTADNQYMDAIAAVFTKATATPVTTQNVPGDYVGALTTYIAAGTPPDVAIFTAEMVPELLRQDAFTNLQPLVARDKLDLTDFVPAALKAYQYKGGLYALPKNFHSLAIWYNADLFHQSAVQPPDSSWKVDTYLEAAQKITNKKSSTFGTTMPVEWETYPWIWLFGGDIVDNPDQPAKTTYSNPRTVQALQLLASLRRQYHVAPTPEEAAAAKGDTNMFYHGSIGMMPYLYIAGRMNSYAKGFSWDVAALASGPDGQHATYIATGGWFLPKGSANPDQGWQFVKSATSPESMKEDAKIGIGIPARLSAASWPEFRAGPPAHKDVFIQQAKYGRLAPIFPGSSQVFAAGWKALQPLFTGNATAADAAANADEAANAAWKKYATR